MADYEPKLGDRVIFTNDRNGAQCAALVIFVKDKKEGKVRLRFNHNDTGVEETRETVYYSPDQALNSYCRVEDLPEDNDENNIEEHNGPGGGKADDKQPNEPPPVVTQDQLETKPAWKDPIAPAEPVSPPTPEAEPLQPVAATPDPMPEHKDGQ